MIDQNDILAREIILENTGGKDPEITLAEDFLDELDLRLEQVKVYYPFMELLRKRQSADKFSRLIPELSFLLLSYLIYEGKLRYKAITFSEIQAFLAKAYYHMFHEELDTGDSRSLTADILDGLQNGGRNFVLETYSFKSDRFHEKFVKFLDIKQSEDGVLQYAITEQGVDFYLKTKEFPEETRITINLLLFQKQMEKGAFGFAYETVRRLNIEVQKKRERKYALLEALMVGRMDSGEAYQNYHQSIILQLQEEEELFGSAVKQVGSAYHEYVGRINNHEATAKELRTFTLIKIIEKEISRAQTLHTQLLKEAVGFTKEYDLALGVRRKAIFTERFNFQGEFEKLLNQNERPEALKYLFEPLLHPYIRKSFNPLRALEPQRVTKDNPEPGESLEEEITAERETIDQITSKRVRHSFLFYAVKLLNILSQGKGYVDLSAFCKALSEQYGEDCIYNGDFVSFLLEINRDKKIGEHFRTIRFGDLKGKLDEELKTMEDVFFKAAVTAKAENRFNKVIVESEPDREIELLPGLKITNMVFKGERNR